MKKYSFLLVILVLLAPATAFAQKSREFVRNQIGSWGECKNVAITKSNGDLALYGSNGWAGTGLPSGLSVALNELNRDKELINDVQITDNGSWLILIGNNGFRGSGLPYGLKSKLIEYHNRNDVVLSVTFNDDGDWIIISHEYFSSSAKWIQEWLQDGHDRYGSLRAACVTSDAMVACYSGGCKLYGNVPSDLKRALQETDMDVYRIKIAGTAWFFGDVKGQCRYNM
ncbi:MAG: hypothetical protein IJ680_02395 [Paludibacteraceae bacterium]|nr:hypothetical protein [Paludibacteraceae bacterium]